jgi:hypothetical protein
MVDRDALRLADAVDVRIRGQAVANPLLTQLFALRGVLRAIVCENR